MSQPFYILGPCGLESEEFAWDMAKAIKEIADRLGIEWYFKASYDKANRTSGDAFRGQVSTKEHASSARSHATLA